MKKKIGVSSRVCQLSTGRVGVVLDVKYRGRPPKALILFDGDSHVDAVWISLDSLTFEGVA